MISRTNRSSYDFVLFDVKRESALGDPNQLSLLDMPLEIIEHILREGNDNNPFSFPFKRLLYLINKPLFILFTSFRYQRTESYYASETKKLLSYVLDPNIDNVGKIIKIAQRQPRLFFFKATIDDHAKDIDGTSRTIQEWSPYQAMYGTNDTNLLSQVQIKPLIEAYLKLPILKNQELAIQQIIDKFPNGFDFPPCTCDFNPLIDAVINDEELVETGIANKTTIAKLNCLRAELKPNIITKGHHYNINILIKAYESIEKYHDDWNVNQNKFYVVHVIGFLQRFLPACYLQVIINGLRNIITLKNRMIDVAPKKRTLN